MAQVKVSEVNALAKHGIRFEIWRGRIFIHSEDIEKVIRLCDKGELPKSIC